MLETELETTSGTVRLIDFMPPRDGRPTLIRIVEGVKGRVEMRMDLTIRFDYGSVVPWLRRVGAARVAIAGPDGLVLRTPIGLAGRNFHTVGEFTVAAGDRVPFTLAWFPRTSRRPQRSTPTPSSRTPRPTGSSGPRRARTKASGTRTSTGRC